MSKLDAIGLARQAAWGTQNDTIGYWVPVESADGGQNAETLEIDETLGTPFPSRVEYGSRFFEIPLAGAVRLNSFPRVLAPFLDDPVTTTPGGGTTTRKHLFDAVAGITPQPHSVYAHRGDPSPAIDDLFYDSIGSELTISSEGNNYLRFEASLIAKAVDETPTPSPPVVVSDFSRRFPFHLLHAFLSVEGGAEAEIPISSFAVTYSVDVGTDEVVLGSRNLYSLPIGNRSGEVAFTPKTTLSAWYRRALAVEPESCKLRIRATGDVLEGALAQYVEVTAFAFETVEAPAGIDASETLSGIDVTGRMAYDETNSKFLDVAVQNAIASYATV